MMSDQEVIIMCKPPERVVTQNKAAGFCRSPVSTYNSRHAQRSCREKNFKKSACGTRNILGEKAYLFYNDICIYLYIIYNHIIFVSRPPAARVSGVVQESPGTLEYEVALYREAARSDDSISIDLDATNEIPVDQAVPIGTKLQLRATINDESAWKYVKLEEVTISTDPKNSYARGHIKLVEKG